MSGSAVDSSAVESPASGSAAAGAASATGAVGQAPAVESIHLAAGRGLPMRPVSRVRAEAGRGLVGDRYHGAAVRQVTVQASGELAEAAAEAGLPIDPGRTRRNITVSAASVPRAAGHRWRIGAVELEVARNAAPCRRMTEIFGPGARESLRGRAGVACLVVTSGDIAVGDAVELGDPSGLGGSVATSGGSVATAGGSAPGSQGAAR